MELAVARSLRNEPAGFDAHAGQIVRRHDPLRFVDPTGMLATTVLTDTREIRPFFHFLVEEYGASGSHDAQPLGATTPCVPFPQCALVAAGVGARGGTVLGGAIGSVLPGVGTLAGAGIGRTAGAVLVGGFTLALGLDLFLNEEAAEEQDLRDLSKGEVDRLKDVIRDDGYPSIEHLKSPGGKNASRLQVRVDKGTGDIVVGPLRGDGEHSDTGYNIRDLRGNQ